MNCQRDHGAKPPSAVMVRISPTRFTKESRKTRKRPRKALPDRCFGVVSPRGCGSLVSSFRSLAGSAHSYPLRALPRLTGLKTRVGACRERLLGVARHELISRNVVTDDDFALLQISADVERRGSRVVYARRS